MPPSDFQARVLSLIAANRSPQSHVAGGLALNMNLARFSFDIDIFNDIRADVERIARVDAESLRAAGFDVEWFREFPTLYSAHVSGPDGTTDVDWAFDSDFRFFAAQPDPLLGWRLHPFDLATNKAFAAAARHEPRDAIDLVRISEGPYPLGIVVWAAVAKDPGFSPLSLLDWIGRFSRYQDYDLEKIETLEPWTAAELSRRLKSALWEAQAFVETMIGHDAGRVYLRDGAISVPDPSRIEQYEIVEATRGGVWPIISTLGEQPE